MHYQSPLPLTPHQPSPHTHYDLHLLSTNYNCGEVCTHSHQLSNHHHHYRLLSSLTLTLHPPSSLPFVLHLLSLSHTPPAIIITTHHHYHYYLKSWIIGLENTRRTFLSAADLRVLPGELLKYSTHSHNLYSTDWFALWSHSSVISSSRISSMKEVVCL